MPPEEARLLQRHRAFLERAATDRPLLGCNVGFFVNERFPRVMQAIPPGVVSPEHLRLDLFLQDCEQLYQDYRKIGDDYPYAAAPFSGLPWMEAIMGCPIVSSPTSLWAEPCIDGWDSWHWQRPEVAANPWGQKLLELMMGLVELSAGRFPTAPTLMRGPSDMIAAMRGAGNLALDVMDSPETVTRAAELCAKVWVEVGKAQLACIPDSPQGYVAGDHGLRVWAPERIIWLQEDAMALLSPATYREVFLPVDRHIARQFPWVAFHLHASALWAVDELARVPEIHIVELNQEEAACDIEAVFAGWHKLQAHKPCVIWRPYQPDFWEWLERVLGEFPPEGLSIQTTARSGVEASQVAVGFDSALAARGR